MIRFLIDECPSPSLLGLAHERGHVAEHVNYVGLRSASDRAIMPYIAGGDYTFVTNNRADFLRLFRFVDVHAGLLVIVPSAKQPEQCRLFTIALDAIEAAGEDMTCQLVEVFADGRVAMSRWPFTDDNI